MGGKWARMTLASSGESYPVATDIYHLAAAVFTFSVKHLPIFLNPVARKSQ